MKIYRVHKYTHSDSSDGFEFYKSKAQAKKALAVFKRITGDDFDEQLSGIEFIKVEMSANGIVELLRQVASKAQNG
jgi:hypothetical protein